MIDAMQRSDTQNLEYYIGPGMGLVFQSLGTIIAMVLAFLGLFAWPLKKFFGLFRRRGKMFFALLIGLILAVILIIAWFKSMSSHNYSNVSHRVIVLGMDGLDPKILEQMMAEGKLPNFSRLKEKGTFSPLATTNPAQSPVAWSSFITGCNPGGHGIFDFLYRDPETYMPDLCLAQSQPPERYLTIGEMKFPLGKFRILSHRKGIPFWELTSKKHIPTVILFCPMTFPPEKIYGRMLSGLGVPDLLGTQGTFSYYTTSLVERREEMGGRVFQVYLEDDTIKTIILGPENTMLKEPKEMTIPLELKLDRKEKKVTIFLQGRQEELKEGEWSNWWRVSFKLNRFTKVRGVCRFYLRSIEPEFGLYLSPINFDPMAPAFPISYPHSFSKKLARKIGFYHTLGQAGDTWALSEGRMDEKATLQQYYQVLKEREDIMLRELEKFRSGIFFSYFIITDTIQHMFWRFMDKEHPMFDEALAEKYKDTIPDLYQVMDKILGKAMNYMDEGTTLIVLSDHGFNTFRRAVHLNTWLYKNGFLKLKDGSSVSEEFFSNVDWSKTKAYALGLGGIYINQRGREGKGIVEPGMETERVKTEIIEKLKNLTDPKTGYDGNSLSHAGSRRLQPAQGVVRHVYRREEIFYGPYIQSAPDLMVGFEVGYRASWQTALGATPSEILEDNRKKWSGDHIFDPELVPGILLMNREINSTDPKIIDIAPTILKLLGVEIPEEMDGKPLI